MHAVLLHARNVLDVLDQLIGVARIVELDVEDGGFADGANQVLEGRNGYEFACPFSVFHDTADAERMIQRGNGIAYLEMVDCCLQVIDDDVVRAFKGAAGEVVKAAGYRVKRLQVNAVQYLGMRSDGKLRHYGGHGNHVLQLSDLVGHLHRNRCAANAHQQGRTRGLHHDVGADADLPVLA